MGRLINETDLMNLLYALDDARHDLCYAIKKIPELPTVEAISKDEAKKILEEGTKNVSNNVLAIVREEYIHKADYENRLKADLKAMLTEIQLEIEKSENCGKAFHLGLQMASNIIQQKINALTEGTDDR